MHNRLAVGIQSTLDAGKSMSKRSTKCFSFEWTYHRHVTLESHLLTLGVVTSCSLDHSLLFRSPLSTLAVFRDQEKLNTITLITLQTSRFKLQDVFHGEEVAESSCTKNS